MSDQRKDGISWTDETWNFLRGCSKVSAGCAHCYAETMATRFNGVGITKSGKLYDLPFEGLTTDGRWTGKVRVIADKLDAPLRWKRPRRIFCNSMSDLFHAEVPLDVIDRAWATMLLGHQHTYQVLTKRPQTMAKYLNEPGLYDRILSAAGDIRREFPQLTGVGISNPSTMPAPWIHLGVSCENQAAADERIPLLLQCPAAVRWVSAEPLLGAIDFEAHFRSKLLPGNVWADCLCDDIDPSDRPCFPCCAQMGVDWVVVGGESGPHARPMHPDWARSIRDQCKAAGVPFHFKQHGEWLPGGFYDGFTVPDCMGAAMNNPKNQYYFEPPGGKCWRVGKKTAGHLLDGREYRMYPGDKW